MSALSKIKKLLSPGFYKSLPDLLITRSNWYRNTFEDAERILRIPQHLDVINLGSNPAKFGLDYSECGLKGYNLAVGPQTVTYDFNVLKNYHSYLDDNGPRLLLLFCPFSLCKDFYTEHNGDVCKDLRYYPMLHRSSILHYDEDLYERWVRHPRKLGVKAYLNAIRHPFRNKALEIDHNPLSEEQMNVSARTYVRNWMREFYLDDLEAENLSETVLSSLKYNSKILDEMIAFCMERDIHPVIVLPPLSPQLNALIPQGIRKACTYSILSKKGIPLLDYTTDERFSRPEYFLDALKLNKKGRIVFTNQVVDDCSRVSSPRGGLPADGKSPPP